MNATKEKYEQTKIGIEKIKSFSEKRDEVTRVKNGIYVKNTLTQMYTFAEFKSLSSEEQNNMFLNPKAIIVYKDKYIDLPTFATDINITALSFINGTNGVLSKIDETIIPVYLVNSTGVSISSRTAAPNNRSNPAGLNTTYIISTSDYKTGKLTYEIEMKELICGDAAWEIVKKANSYNSAPKEGKEYILAKFRVKILKTEKDEAFDIFFGIFFYPFSQQGVEYTDFVSVAGLDPKLSGGLYQGSEKTGYTAFLVNKGDNAVVMIDKYTNGGTWFSLRAK